VRTAAILPVKRFDQAKQRLGASVADPLRLALTRAMVTDVLSALARTPALELTIVVTCEPAASAAARELGAVVLADAPQSGQSAAASVGVRYAVAAGIERVLCIPGDCPTLDPGELQALLSGARSAGAPAGPPLQAPAEDAGARRAEVVIVPDRHGSGTNGLLLAPPDAIAPSFGPDSCARHRELARAAGADWRLERVPSLLLDIDTGADLAVLRERLAGLGAHATRTGAVLGQGDRGETLSLTTPA